MRKGNIATDVVLIIVVLFVLGLIMPFIYQFIKEYNTDIQADTDMSDSMKAYSANVTDKWSGWTDNAFVMIFILAWMMIMVLSFFIDAHPVFLIFAVILLIFIIGFGMILSNSYHDMITTDTDLTSFTSEYPKTIFILEHLGHFAFAMGFSVALVLYGKLRLR